MKQQLDSDPRLYDSAAHAWLQRREGAQEHGPADSRTPPTQCTTLQLNKNAAHGMIGFNGVRELENKDWLMQVPFVMLNAGERTVPLCDCNCECCRRFDYTQPRPMAPADGVRKEGATCCAMRMPLSPRSPTLTVRAPPNSHRRPVGRRL